MTEYFLILFNYLYLFFQSIFDWISEYFFSNPLSIFITTSYLILVLFLILRFIIFKRG